MKMLLIDILDGRGIIEQRGLIGVGRRGLSQSQPWQTQLRANVFRFD